MMVVSVPVTMHLRRMSRLVPGSMAVIMRGSRSMGLRIMGMAVGVLIMRMAVPVHGVVRMSVIICRRLIGLTLLTHAQ